GVREGSYYYEVKILRGIGSEGGDDAHVRVGWARREGNFMPIHHFYIVTNILLQAPLDTPVGFDAYSYGIRDISGQAVHMSRPKDFMNESLSVGDVIGLQIVLPPLSTQRQLLHDIISSSSSTSYSQPTPTATASQPPLPSTSTFHPPPLPPPHIPPDRVPHRLHHHPHSHPLDDPPSTTPHAPLAPPA